MKLSRRRAAFAGFAALAGVSLYRASYAQGSEEAAVNQAIDDLRKAMLAADQAGLEALVADQLSYGHSGGVVESKAQFVNVIIRKKTIYKSITLSEPNVAVVGNKCHRAAHLLRRLRGGWKTRSSAGRRAAGLE